MLDPLCKGGRPKIPSILISSFEYIDPELIDIVLPCNSFPYTSYIVSSKLPDPEVDNIVLLSAINFNLIFGNAIAY